MGLFTLRFDDYDQAKAAAIQLGFWSPGEPIYEQRPTGETETRWVYVDKDEENGLPLTFYSEPTAEEVAYHELQDECTYVFKDTEEVPVIESVQVGMTEGQVNTRGNSKDADGKDYGWAIDLVGQDPVIEPGTYDEEGNESTPPVVAKGYFANVTGELPPAAEVFKVPYGSAGRRFATGD